MCGINVIIDRSSKASREHIERMQMVSAHRGPDASRIIDRHVSNVQLFLGSHRLRIIDANPDSDQPFFSTCSNYVLLYNGEVYNHNELRKQLEKKGQQFRTQSDTEVVLYWLMCFGQEGLSAFEGMFSLVFFDLITGEGLASRDRAGIKPLFYSQYESKLLFASEPKSIVSSQLIPKELNTDAVPQYLHYKYISPPQTFYKHIYEVLPGESISFQVAKNGVEKKQFPNEIVANQKKGLKEHLIDSIRKRLTVDSTPCLMLSGGVDSTLLMAVINKELGINRFPAVTLLDKKASSEINEIHLSQQAARQYYAEHYQMTIDIDVLGRIDEYVENLDQPVADSGAFATWLVSEFIQPHHRVLLSGAGADEYFAGYNRHWAFYQYLKWHRIPYIHNLLKQVFKYPVLNRQTQIRKFISSLNTNPKTVFDNFRALEINNDLYVQRDPEINSLSMEQNMEWALKHDQTNYLVSDVLAVSDRASMQHGVELRVPFLDQNIIDYSRSVSGLAKISGGKKHMIKELLSGYKGQIYCKAKKAGFGLPTNSWFRSHQTSSLWDFINKDALIFNFVSKCTINGLLFKHRKHKYNYGSELWALLLLQRWLSKEFE